MRVATGPKGRPFIGHLTAFRADRLGFFAHCARTYGDVVPLRLLHRRLLLVSHPDLIEEVLITKAANFIKHFGLRIYKPILGNGLVTSEGDFWRRQRKLSAPAFHPGRLAGYAASMTSDAQRMIKGWESNEGGEQIRDVHADLMRLTLEIACTTLFGTDATPDPTAIGRSMHDGLKAIAVRFSRPFPIPEWVPVPWNVRLRKALRPLNAAVSGMIARRRSAGDGANGNDLLSILLAARDEEGSAMSDAQLLEEVRTIFLAGHETTALALSYSLYLLAAHRDPQEKLRVELNAVLAGRVPAHDDVPRLAYARKIVIEAMRLYPPADVLGREAVADCTIGDFPVKKGTSLFMSQWVMHHDPRFFKNPETFDPDRWTEQFEKALPRFAYFPFGGGPRFCIGQAFAVTEAILVLATICQRFSFAPAPGFKLELWPSITLRPRNGVRLVVKERRLSGPLSVGRVTNNQ